MNAHNILFIFLSCMEVDLSSRLAETTYFGRIVSASEFHESTRYGTFFFFFPFGKIGLHQAK